MHAPRRTPAASGAALGLLVLVVAGTLALLRLPDPERAVVSALDGSVQVEGRWSPSAPPRIDLSPSTGPFTAVRSAPHTVVVSASVTGQPYTLTFQVPKDIALRDAVLYWADSAIGGWRAVPSAPTESDWAIQAVLERLPTRTWAVGIPYTPTPSVQAAAALRSLVAVPPPGATGYRAALLSASVPGDYVVVRDPFETGGCDGHFQSGKEQTRTSMDVTETERVVVLWELETGCVPGVVIRPVVRDPS